MNTHELIVHSLLNSDAMLMYCQGCGAEINVGVMPTMDALLQAAVSLKHTDFPEPTTTLNAVNVRGAVECVEFLLTIARRNTDDLDGNETAQFQETNWNTLVASMRAWADSLPDAATQQSDTPVSQQTTHNEEGS